MFIRKITLWLCALLGTALSALTGAEQSAGTGPAEAAGNRRTLRQILIAESVEAAQAMTPVPNAGLVVLSPAFARLDAAELTKRLSGGENRPIDEKLLAAIAQVIEVFFRQRDFLVATTVIPSQSIAEGAVRIAVLTGKLRNVRVQGNRWFSESLLREKLRLEQGGTLLFSELDRAIAWTNNNPFRRVQVHAEAVPNTGDVDLTIAVQEAMPLRLMATYDNAGNQAFGRNRYTAAMTYANLWGLDHQVSLQFITGDRPRLLKVYGFDYRIPLRWRHYLQLSASNMQARPEFYEGLIVQDATTITSDVRYSIPLRGGDSPAEVYAGVNFKHSNNNLAFGGSQVFGTATDTFQFTAGASMVRRDKRGAWAFGTSLSASPGGVNSRNTNAAFDSARYGGSDSARLGAKAAYIYGGLSAQRLLVLMPGWDLVSRAVLQVSQANLLPSEMLSIGGASTVRGFPENVFSGDHGIVFSSELMAPPWKKPLPRLSKTKGPLEVRPLAFLDTARVGVHQAFPTDSKRVSMASVGAGVRMNFGPTFSLTADYGWQLTYLPYPVDEKSRGHLRASLAF